MSLQNREYIWACNRLLNPVIGFSSDQQQLPPAVPLRETSAAAIFFLMPYKKTQAHVSVKLQIFPSTLDRFFKHLTSICQLLVGGRIVTHFVHYMHILTKHAMTKKH